MNKATNGGRAPSTSLGILISACGLSRQTVAQAVGVSVHTVHSWCTARSRMRLDHFTQIVNLARTHSSQHGGIEGSEFDELVSGVLLDHGLSPSVLSSVSRIVKSGTRRTCLFLAPELLNRGGVLSVLGARDYLTSSGWELLLHSPKGSHYSVSRSYLDLIASRAVQGTIVIHPVDPDLLRQIKAVSATTGAGTIELFTSSGNGTRADLSVKIDNYLIGRLCAEYLLGQDCENITTFEIHYPDSMYMKSYDERLKGFLDSLTAAGRPAFSRTVTREHGKVYLGPDSMRDSATVHYAAESLSAWRQIGINGVFCLSEPATIALGFAFDSSPEKALLAAWPQVVGAVSGGGSGLMVNPHMAYIEIPSYELGREAARLLSTRNSEQPKRAEQRRVEVLLQPTLHRPSVG